MRYVFIVNPIAGKRNRSLEWLPKIQAYFSEHPEVGDFKCRITAAPGDAGTIAREEAAAGGEVCVVACGGDGTLMEVAEGLYGASNAVLACLPCGSANDFLRSFPDADFSDLDALVHGDIRDIDAIRCGDRISINICSMGMDADVAAKKDRYKDLPLISGSLAYQMAIVDVFCHRIGKTLRISMDTPDGKVEESGRFFFALAASGQYYGGGYRGAPQALTDDGLLDFVLVKAMPRLRVLRFLGQYKKGLHAGIKECRFYRGTKMQVFCEEGAQVNLDGECLTKTEAIFEILPHAFRFLVPRKSVENIC